MTNNNDNLFIQDEKNIIYKYIIDNIPYYLSIPLDISDNYQIFISFNNKNDFNSEEIINFIKDTNQIISSTNKSGILVIPCINQSELSEASFENDRRLYIKLFNKIHKITNDVYLKLNEKSFKLNQVIIFIKHNSIDSKFIDWLEINMNGFIKSINLSNYYHSEETLQDEGWTTYGSRSGVSSNNLTNTHKDVKIKKLVPPKKKSSGFSTFTFISLTLIISLIIGISISYLLIE